MKAFFTSFIFVAILSGSCKEQEGDKKSKKGIDSMNDPIMNVGADAEKERNVNVFSDSTARGDSDANSKPR